MILAIAVSGCHSGIIGTWQDQAKKQEAGIAGNPLDGLPELPEVAPAAKSMFEMMPAMDAIGVLKIDDFATSPFIPIALGGLASAIQSGGGMGLLKGLSTAKEMLDTNYTNFILMGLKMKWVERDMIKIFGFDDDELDSMKIGISDADVAAGGTHPEGGIIIANSVTEQRTNQIFQTILSLAGGKNRSIVRNEISFRAIGMDLCDNGDNQKCEETEFLVTKLDEKTVVMGTGKTFNDFINNYVENTSGGLTDSNLWKVFQTLPAEVSMGVALSVPLTETLETMLDDEKFADFKDKFYAMYIGEKLPSQSSMALGIAFGGAVSITAKVFAFDDLSKPAMHFSLGVSEDMMRALNIGQLAAKLPDMFDDKDDADISLWIEGNNSYIVATPGTTASITVKVERNGYDGEVAFGYDAGESGITMMFEETIETNGTMTVPITVQMPQTIGSGAYDVDITASAGETVQRTRLNIAVSGPICSGSYVVTVKGETSDSNYETIQAEGSGNYIIDVNNYNFSGSVELSAVTSKAGFEPTVTVTPNPLILNGDDISATATMTIAVPIGTTPLLYPMSLNATNSECNKTSNSAFIVSVVEAPPAP